MKPSYQITEVARLYGLNPDTLRYYEEQGLLHPVRGENRYRMYGIDDICNINVIRALRELGIPVDRIRRYTEDRRCETTLRLLDEQEEVIGRKLTQLRRARAQVRARRGRILAAQALPVGQIRVMELPDRRGLSLRQNRIFSFEIDYALKKLENRHAEGPARRGQLPSGGSDPLFQGVFSGGGAEGLSGSAAGGTLSQPCLCGGLCRLSGLLPRSARLRAGACSGDCGGTA